MSTETLGIEEFTAILRRWFFADAMTEAEIARLHAQWRELAGDEARLRGQDQAFEPRDRLAFGYAWWEERQQGRLETLWPEDAASRVKMFLTHEGPPAGPLPTPRPYCPDKLVGRWRCVGRAARYGGDVAPLAGDREWRLTDDGRLAAVGDAAHDGMRWWAHRGLAPDDLELRIGPRSPRLGASFWRVVSHRGAEMDLSGPETPGGFLRWSRQ